MINVAVTGACGRMGFKDNKNYTRTGGHESCGSNRKP